MRELRVRLEAVTAVIERGQATQFDSGESYE
jgi:hypothetical protein